MSWKEEKKSEDNWRQSVEDRKEKPLRIQLTSLISTTNTTNIQIMSLEDEIQQLNKN